jgi:hypothetical protein
MITFEQMIARLRRADVKHAAFLKRLAEPRKALSWLINFALRENLTTLSRSKRSDLAREAYYFCVSLGGRPVLDLDMSGEDLKKLATTARYLLDAPGHGERGIDLKLKFTLYIDRDPETGALRQSYLGEFLELWPLFVSSLVAKHGDRVRSCRLKECGKPFLVIKRQLYCSASCAQKDRSRRYRGDLNTTQLRAIRVRGYARELETEKSRKDARDFLLTVRDNEPEVAAMARIAELFKQFGIKRSR